MLPDWRIPCGTNWFLIVLVVGPLQSSPLARWYLLLRSLLVTTLRLFLLVYLLMSCLAIRWLSLLSVRFLVCRRRLKPGTLNDLLLLLNRLLLLLLVLQWLQLLLH